MFLLLPYRTCVLSPENRKAEDCPGVSVDPDPPYFRRVLRPSEDKRGRFTRPADAPGRMNRPKPLKKSAIFRQARQAKFVTV
jgi:hypothetical protein